MLIAELKSRRALFRHRPYRLFAASGLAATFGNGLVYIALAWDGWQKSGSLATLAWLMACLWLPTVLLGPLFGVCADRCERKTLLILSNGARGAALIVFAVAALAGAGWPIAVLALTLGVFQAFYFPAALPMVRDMFEPARRLEANATVDILYEFGTIAGMAASGVLIAQAGGGAAFLGGGLCFLAAAALCVPLPASRAAPSPEAGPNPWHDLVAVARYLAHRPQLGSAGLAQALVMILLMTVPVLLVPFASQVLGAGAREFSWLEALYSFGVCVGGLLSPRLCRAVPIRQVLQGQMLLLGLALGVFALSRELASACGWYLLVGVGMAAWAVSLTLVQDLTDDPFHGRLQAGCLSLAGVGVLAVYALLQAAGETLAIGWIYALECLLALVAAGLLFVPPRPAGSI
jgi:MFS family permease